jgi:hypothetical protein
MASFKNRWKIIQEEMIDKKWKRIYVERKIKEIIKDRYAHGEINVDSSYIYQKMDKLVDKKIYLPVWNNWYYAKEQGFVNIFDLHKRLDDMIRIHHLPQRKSKLYNKKEKKYMEEFIRSRKISEDRGLFVSH